MQVFIVIFIFIELLTLLAFVFVFFEIQSVEKRMESNITYFNNKFRVCAETVEGLKFRINGLSEKSYGQDSFIVDLQNEVKSKITHADLDAQKNYLEMKIDSIWKNLGENPSVDTVMDQIYRRVSENVFKETKDRHEAIMSGLYDDIQELQTRRKKK